MGLPYFPMYPTDFEADTSHLTLAEDGAYNRLLRLMWMTPGCSLPDDDAWIKRRMRCQNDADFETVLTVISEFFTRKAGRIVSPRLAKEYQKTDLAHKKRVEAGSKGGKAKALKTNDTEPSKAKAMPKQPEPEPEPYKKEDTNVSLSELHSAPDEIQEAIDVYNSQAEATGWPKVQKITAKRKAAIKARLKEVGGLDGWRMAVDKAANSPMLCGGNSRGWVASFDFLTNQSSFTKLMEGNYDPRQSTSKQSTRADFDTAHREYARRVGAGEIDFGPDPSDPFAGG